MQKNCIFTVTPIPKNGLPNLERQQPWLILYTKSKIPGLKLRPRDQMCLEPHQTSKDAIHDSTTEWNKHPMKKI
jgi:galactose mutarotase-like enzyme